MKYDFEEILDEIKTLEQKKVEINYQLKELQKERAKILEELKSLGIENPQNLENYYKSLETEIEILIESIRKIKNELK